MARMEFQHRALVKWPRAETQGYQRKGNVFRAPAARTLQLLARELSALGAINPILLTTDHQNPKDIRIDGLPRFDIKQPSRPGAIVEFYAQLGKDKKRERLQYACDTYRTWHHNLHAIVLTLEALRAVDRYGATAAGEQYAGFKALPPPQNLLWTAEDAARFLAAMPGVGFTAEMIIASADRARLAYLAAAKSAHPDAGGSAKAWEDLQRAKQSLDQHHGRGHQ